MCALVTSVARAWVAAGRTAAAVVIHEPTRGGVVARKAGHDSLESAAVQMVPVAAVATLAAVKGGGGGGGGGVDGASWITAQLLPCWPLAFPFAVDRLSLRLGGCGWGLEW